MGRQEENLYVRACLVILLDRESGAEITLRLDLFEDVLSEDWIHQKRGRERDYH